MKPIYRIPAVLLIFTATAYAADYSESTPYMQSIERYRDGNEVVMPAAPPPQTNLNASFDILGTPQSVTAGETFTATVIVTGAVDVGAYFVNLAFDPAKLEFREIVEGPFLSSQEETLTFTTIRETTVGVSSSIYGNDTVSGDGILCEATFRAVTSTDLTNDILRAGEILLVDSEYVTVDVVTGTVGVDAVEPPPFSVEGAHPNPFNPSTVITFSMPRSGRVRLTVYDILGRKVDVCSDGMMDAGTHFVRWNGTDAAGSRVSAGVYLFAVEYEGHVRTGRMTLLK